MFPQTEDPKGDHSKWSEEEMRLWLNNVSWRLPDEVDEPSLVTDKIMQRDLQPTGKETRQELLVRIEANKRAPRV